MLRPEHCPFSVVDSASGGPRIRPRIDREGIVSMLVPTPRRLLAGLTGLALMATAALTVSPAAPASAAPLTKVLVFSKTAGFRHSAIPDGIAAIQQLGAQNGFSVTATEDAAQFSTANLAQYQAVVWPPRTCRRTGRAPTSGTTTEPTPGPRYAC
jgi:hypothetical protein